MRIAIYVRVSTRRQAQTQTIEQQLDRLQSHLQSQGWQVLDENIFRDDGYSGANSNCPGVGSLAGSGESRRNRSGPDSPLRIDWHGTMCIR